MSSEKEICARSAWKSLSFARIKESLKRFYDGKIYPIVIACLVALGHVTATEFYLVIPFLVLACGALIICDSTKPLLMPMAVFIYQLPLKHSPGWPTNSGYYFEGARLVILLLLTVITLTALMYRFVICVKEGMRRDTPMLLPLSLLCAAFLLNGVFSSGWHWAGLLVGFIEAFVYFFTFYIFYLGLRGESKDGLVEYFCYITLLIAAVIVAEMAFMFMTYDGIIVDGSIVKTKVNLGWGIWNPIGFSLTVLIPMLVFGAMKMRYPAVYVVASVITYLCAALTMSRNALIFATLALIASYVIGCFAGARKLMFRIITLAGAAVVLVAAVVMWDKIAGIFATVMEQGFDNNGRFDLWRAGIESFTSAPVFGKGFCSTGTGSDIASFIPTMAHNTVVQVLAAMGIFGMAAYAYYRAHSLVPFIARPTLEKSMLLMPMLITVGMSLLDNFVFYVYTVFYYAMAMAIAFVIYDSQKAELESKSEEISQY